MRYRNRGRGNCLVSHSILGDIFNTRPFSPDNEFFAPTFDRFMNDLRSSMFSSDNFFITGTYPKWDVVKEKDKVTIIAGLPGMIKENIHIDIKDEYLTLSGDATKRVKSENRKYITEELCCSSFKRTIGPLDESVYDLEHISAKMEEGLLTISIPLVEIIDVKDEKKVKEIPIQ